ncbi:MAG: LysM peptidoglycan-binding domain-containing protein [Clostridia bacterium]|nr:LysM peptidoglycan-binding domain-containing protein [Clostridia bacterium]
MGRGHPRRLTRRRRLRGAKNLGKEYREPSSARPESGADGDGSFSSEAYDAGLEAVRSGNLTRALRMLRTAANARPDMVEAWVEMGRIHAQMGEHGRAVKCWKRALAIDPSNTASKAGIARANRIRVSSRKPRVFARALVILAGCLLVILAVVWLRGSIARRSARAPIAPKSTAPGMPAVTSAPAASAVTGAPDGADASAVATSMRGVLDALDPAVFRGITITASRGIVKVSGAVPSDSDLAALRGVAAAMLGGVRIDLSAVGSEGAVLHTVHKGDTLWLIAQRYYGDGRRWPEILRRNPALKSDPNGLRVGDEVVVPNVAR